MNKICEQSGFTLIEALVAMVILTIGILTLYTMQVSSIHGNSTANQITKATTTGANQLEDIFAMDYEELTDTDGDSDDPDAKSFGLYDFTDDTVDGKATTSEGHTIYWNVADDQPMPATKRVVVNVVFNDRAMSKSVQYEYIKAQVVGW